MIEASGYGWRNVNYLHTSSGTIEEIASDDISGSRMWKYIVHDSSSNEQPFRIYPDYTGPPIVVPKNGYAEVAVQVEFSSGYLPPSGGFVNFLSVFSETPRSNPTKNGYSVLASILTDSGSSVPKIYANRSYVGWPPFAEYKGRMPIEPNIRYEMLLRIRGNGDVEMLIQRYDIALRQFVDYDTARGHTDPVHRVQIAALHAGAYGALSEPGSWIKNGTISLTVYE